MIGGKKIEEALGVFFVDGADFVYIYGDAVLGFSDKEFLEEDKGNKDAEDFVSTFRFHLLVEVEVLSPPFFVSDLYC